jgi:hypothetical protein
MNSWGAAYDGAGFVGPRQTNCGRNEALRVARVVSASLPFRPGLSGLPVLPVTAQAGHEGVLVLRNMTNKSILRRSAADWLSI